MTTNEHKQYNVLDIFAGAGGLSNGFLQTEKFKIVGAIEKNKDAQKTFLANHPDTIMYDDIKLLDKQALLERCQKIDVVIGGPPCQGFSNANRQHNSLINTNNQLLKNFIDIINVVKPKAFVLENVKQLDSKKNRYYLTEEDVKLKKDLNIEMETIIFSIENNIGKEIVSLSDSDLYRYYNERLYQFLNIIYKKRNNFDKFEKAKNFYQENIIGCIEDYSKGFTEENKLGKWVKETLVGLKNSFKNPQAFLGLLNRYISIEKLVRALIEIKEHKLVVETITADIKEVKIFIPSYSIKDFIHYSFKENYVIVDGIVEAVKFGVPQYRKRYILIGAKNDLYNKKLELPKPIIDETEFSVGEAILDLSNIDPEIDVKSDVKYITKEIHSKMVSEYYRNDIGLELYNHIATNSRSIAKSRFHSLKPGQNFHDLSPKLKETYTEPERTQNSIYLRLKPEAPSGTVTNVRKAMWIHPLKDRAISIREAARLQTFKDNFIFYGTKDSQYQQVGNAVPPILARAVAEKILEILSDKPVTMLSELIESMKGDNNGKNK